MKTNTIILILSLLLFGCSTTSIVLENGKTLNIDKDKISNSPELNDYLSQYDTLYCEVTIPKFRVFDKSYSWIEFYESKRGEARRSIHDAIALISFSNSEDGAHSVIRIEPRSIEFDKSKPFFIISNQIMDSVEVYVENKVNLIHCG